MYANDTAIMGAAEEVKQAEPIFSQTVASFAGKVHEHKTESLRVCQIARSRRMTYQQKGKHLLWSM